jgi:hypothetical protein
MMDRPHVDFARFSFKVVVEDRESGQEITLRFLAPDRADVIASGSGSPVGTLFLETDGPRFEPVPGQLRDAVSAGNCIRECARGCRGDALCAAACVAGCLTILPD